MVGVHTVMLRTVVKRWKGKQLCRELEGQQLGKQEIREGPRWLSQQGCLGAWD